MSKKLIISLLFIAFITISANAQTNLLGTYFYDKKIDDGRNTLRLIFELKEKNRAVYSNKQDETETQRRFGSWIYNKKLNQITVVMPPVKNNPIQGQEVKLTFVFKVVGNKLKLIRDLPYKEGTGEIYQKL
jgi:hypothetical protein